MDVVEFVGGIDGDSSTGCVGEKLTTGSGPPSPYLGSRPITNSDKHGTPGHWNNVRASNLAWNHCEGRHEYIIQYLHLLSYVPSPAFSLPQIDLFNCGISIPHGPHMGFPPASPVIPIGLEGQGLGYFKLNA